MGEILLMPLGKKTVPEFNLQMLRAEQLSRFAAKVERSMIRAVETENFTKLAEEDSDELIDFYYACAEIYESHRFEISQLHKNRKEYTELNKKYGMFISPEQRYIDSALFVLMREFDSEMDNLISDEFEDVNFIIKQINAGKFSDEWYILYDFYQMLHMDNLAQIVAQKMADLGDEYAKSIIERDGWMFSDISDMIESYTPKNNVTNKKDNSKEESKPSPDDFKKE